MTAQQPIEPMVKPVSLINRVRINRMATNVLYGIFAVGIAVILFLVAIPLGGGRRAFFIQFGLLVTAMIVSTAGGILVAGFLPIWIQVRRK